MERESYRVRDESIKRSKLFEQISNIESHISYRKPDRISGVFNARPQAACGHNLSTTKVICMRLWPLCALPSSRVCSVLPCICNFLHGRVDHHHQSTTSPELIATAKQLARQFHRWCSTVSRRVTGGGGRAGGRSVRRRVTCWDSRSSVTAGVLVV
jgi:hypothetical protein